MVKSELVQKLCNIHPNVFRSDMEKFVKVIIFEIVEEVFKEKGKNIIREVTFSSSNKKSLGLTFVGGVKK